MAKKIMFNDKYSLTQAVLEGRKTMTRRVCKYDRPNETYDIVFPVFEPNDYDNDGNIVSPLNYAFGWKNDKGDFTGWNIPKYKVGEVVAIAQSYESLGMNPEHRPPYRNIRDQRQMHSRICRKKAQDVGPCPCCRSEGTRIKTCGHGQAAEDGKRRDEVQGHCL